MALRRIVLQGEDCLTKVCRPVTDFDNRLHILLNDMADTLLDSGGVGLAAPQVGILRRVCVVQNENDEIIELINPEIVYTQGEQTGLEGCLSVPGKFGVVTRPEVVRVRAQDRDGNFFEVSAEMCATIRTMLDMTAKERTAARNNAARLADKAQWKNFIKYYYQAYDFALGR